MIALAPFFCALFAAVPQQPAGIEGVGPAREPSTALREHLEKGAEKGNDELLLFDVCYGVRQSVVRLHDVWAVAESTRARGMLSLLFGMQERCGRSDDAAAKPCADVAAVALALLHPSFDRVALTPAQRDELREVEAAGAGSQRFLREPVAKDWNEARPIGAYAQHDGYAPLYRATVYVLAYRNAWPEDVRATWQLHAEALRGGDTGDLARTEAAWSVLFGVRLDASGVGEPVRLPDREWLATNGAEAASAREKLTEMFAAVSMREPVATNDGVLRLCHELAIARATDPVFAAMPPRQWQAKWCDAAAFAYVGLREVDALLPGPGLPSAPPPGPTVIVEPLPAVWEAIAWLQQRCDAVEDAVYRRGADTGDRRRPWIADVLAALRLQQKGEDVPAELNERLRRHLLNGFVGADDGLETAMRIESIRGDVRRAVPQLVRVPIVWRGETRKALALRLFVEQQGPDGRWHAAQAAQAEAPPAGR